MAEAGGFEVEERAYRDRAGHEGYLAATLNPWYYGVLMALSAGVSIGIRTSLVPAVMLSVALVVPPLIFVLAGRRRAIQIGPPGLVVQRNLRAPQVIPWSDVRGVNCDDATIFTTDGAIDIGRHVTNWQDLAAAVSAALAQARSEEADADELPSAEIAAWLELQPGERLRICGFGLGKVCYAVAIALAALGVWFGHRGNVTLWMLFIWQAIYPALFGVVADRQNRLTEVVLDDQGIEAGWQGRRQFVPWAQVWECELRHRRWAWGMAITSAKGECWLSARHPLTERAVNAITKVVAARDAGKRLPNMGTVSPAALSRLTGEADPEASSLSRSEPPG